MSYRYWTKKEIEEFKVDYAINKLSMIDLCSIYKRTHGSLSTMASDLNLKRRKIRTPDSTIVKMYLSGLSCIKISKTIKCDATTVCNVLKRNKIEQRPDRHVSNKLYTINQNYFDKIETQEAAYFLGFIYADGNISKNSLVISLEKNDRDILDKFNKLLETNKPLRPVPGKGRDKPQFCLSVHNKYMTKVLKTLGVMECKSLILKFPDWLNPKLYSHFIRGYFDGDGSISLSVRKKDYSCSFCGTLEFLNSIQKIFFDCLNIKWRKLYRKKSIKVNSYSISYTGRIQVENIMDWMYNGATIWLSRKKEKYENLREKVNKSVIKKHYRTTVNFLNKDQIDQIREKFRQNIKFSLISKEFNISRSTFYNITRRLIPKYKEKV